MHTCMPVEHKIYYTVYVHNLKQNEAQIACAESTHKGVT